MRASFRGPFLPSTLGCLTDFNAIRGLAQIESLRTSLTPFVGSRRALFNLDPNIVASETEWFFTVQPISPWALN